MIRLGGGGIPLQSEDPWEMARAHKDFGYSAAYCPEVSLADTPIILVIRCAFAKEDVLIAEVGAWSNLVDPDKKQREANFRYVCEKLAVADEVGARCCIDFIGSIAPNSLHGPHPFNLRDEGFELCVQTVRRIIDEVKPRRTKFCLEMMQWVLPDSPEVCLELIKAVNRPAFAAHMDPVNLILTPRQYFSNGQLIKQCFDLLGPWIVSCHAKDLILRDKLALHFDEVIVGQGNLDYKTYLQELVKLKDVPILLEHLSSTEEYVQARDHLFSVGEGIGIDFYSNG